MSEVLDVNLDDETEEAEVTDRRPSLDAELRRLGGPGPRGTVLSLTRYWPVTACGLSLAGALTGSVAAVLCFVGGLLALGLMLYADRLVRSGRPLPARLSGGARA